MNSSDLIEKIKSFVKMTLEGAEAGHDWFHIERVYKNSLIIARKENADVLVVSLGSLLHDIADAKFHGGNEELGPEIADNFLDEIGVPEKTRHQVVDIVRKVSFKNSLDNKVQKNKSIELAIVQDADRLDAIGAIGIARTFHYGGFKNREIYNPDIAPDIHQSKEAYKKSTTPTINHFYEKLLRIKSMMNTETGKALAENRHQFMEKYLEQFYAEWEAKR